MEKVLKKKIFVKIPFGYGSNKFKIMRSKPWGAVDLMILQALIGSPSTSHDLATRSGLPRQLIVEILIPLMRAGWVEISNSENDFRFHITQRGLAVSSGDDLPANQEPLSHVRSFLVDPITAQCYRIDRKKKWLTFQAYKAGKARSILNQYGSYTAEVKIKDPNFSPNEQDIYDCVAYDYEEVFGFEDEFVKLDFYDSVRYIVACVDADDKISGTPDISVELKEVILSAAKKQREKVKLLEGSSSGVAITSELHQASKIARLFGAHKIAPNNILLISGSIEQSTHLQKIIAETKSRLIIHSTFINAECVEVLFESLLEAARRSVQIDILWGQTEPEKVEKISEYNRLIEALNNFQKRIDTQGLSTQFQFHSTPTNSHCKFIIADNQEEQWSVTIGSCNWLSSRFNRFEVSVHIIDAQIASEMLTIASHLAIGRLGIANSLSRDLAVTASRVSKQSPERCEDKGDGVRVRIITAPEHHSLVKEASDNAVSEIFVCSHRFSFAGERPILTPLLAAKKKVPSLAIKVAYGRPSGSMKARDAFDAKTTLEKSGLSVLKADDPQIHAKFISWDKSNLIVSSLNWLSASTKGDNFSELGLHIVGGNFSTNLQKDFDDFYA